MKTKRWTIGAAGGVRGAVAGALMLLGCGGPDVPANPTWLTVRPILAAQCAHCHGPTAARTGNGFRFDFYEMSATTCNEAAAAVGVDAPLARTHAGRIWNAITSDDPGVRPIMPPLPASYLQQWQWQTIQRWVERGAPKGEPPADNHPPTIAVQGLGATVDAAIELNVVVADAEAEPVAGVLMIGDVPLRMDRSGAFSARLDTTGWPEGERQVRAVLCDGWSSVSIDLGKLEVDHTP